LAINLKNSELAEKIFMVKNNLETTPVLWIFIIICVLEDER
jgi:hypothetical protein